MEKKESQLRSAERASKKAGDNLEKTVNCARSTLAALQDEFNLPGGEDLLNAATFMPGIVTRGETCGAVIGGLMALGLVYGKLNANHLSWGTEEGEKERFRLKAKARKFCDIFEQILGSTQCGVLLPKIMGPDFKVYDGMDPRERQRFLSCGGAKKCRVPPETAARIAASIILEG